MDPLAAPCPSRSEALGMRWSRRRGAGRVFLATALVLGVGYVTFMCTVDIPMYLSRWLADQAAGREYLSLSQGFQDTWSRRVVTFEWEAWRPEIPWMTLYFSVCVWWSLALVHAPRPGPDRPAAGEPRFVPLDSPRCA